VCHAALPCLITLCVLSDYSSHTATLSNAQVLNLAVKCLVAVAWWRVVAVTAAAVGNSANTGIHRLLSVIHAPALR
jgi:hypothetical protein